MKYLYIALAAVLIAILALAAVLIAILAGALIWRYGRLERRKELNLEEKERLRGFRIAGGTDSQFVAQLRMEDDRFETDDIMRAHKIRFSNSAIKLVRQ
jgi:hypothetical protein